MVWTTCERRLEGFIWWFWILFHLFKWKDGKNFTHRRATFPLPTPNPVLRSLKNSQWVVCSGPGTGDAGSSGDLLGIWHGFYYSTKNYPTVPVPHHSPVHRELRSLRWPKPSFLPEDTCRQSSSVRLGQGGRNGRSEWTILEYLGVASGNTSHMTGIEMTPLVPICDVRAVEGFLPWGLGSLALCTQHHQVRPFQRFRQPLRCKGWRSSGLFLCKWLGSQCLKVFRRI